MLLRVVHARGRVRNILGGGGRRVLLRPLCEVLRGHLALRSVLLHGSLDPLLGGLARLARVVSRLLRRVARQPLRVRYPRARRGSDRVALLPLGEHLGVGGRAAEAQALVVEYRPELPPRLGGGEVGGVALRGGWLHRCEIAVDV